MSSLVSSFIVFIYLSRVGIVQPDQADDFWFQDPQGDPMGVYWLQGVHMIHCAYNSMWMGRIIQPDWDMFQSDHLCAKFHAASRAICGGPVYVSDSLGGHDFDLLRKLVFPDGTIPKCQHFALPTRDCIFKNPLFDKKTILKIWNLNKFGGVIGAFNCQGGGWDPEERRIKGHSECYMPMMVSVHVTDIEWNQKIEAADEYAVYFNTMEELHLVTPQSDSIQISITPSSFEIFIFVAIKNIGSNIKFAPLGLTNMINSGGTLQDLQYSDSASVKVEVKGVGKFLTYSSEPPKKCYVNGVEVKFEYIEDGGKLSLHLSWVKEASGVSDVSFVF